MPDRERIVVGVDGSEQSLLALRWAHREAALRDASLDVVHVSSESRLLADAEQLDRLVQEGVGEDDSVPVQLHLRQGPAAPALIETAKDADLIVVGSHGRQAFGGLRLGSVSQQVADHAPCPVVVVR